MSQCYRTTLISGMVDVEYSLLAAGQEDEALEFFYSTFVADEGQLSSLGAGRNAAMTEMMVAMLAAGPTLVARVGGAMVGQLVMEVQRRGEEEEEPPTYPALLARCRAALHG